MEDFIVPTLEKKLDSSIKFIYIHFDIWEILTGIVVATEGSGLLANWTFGGPTLFDIIYLSLS